MARLFEQFRQAVEHQAGPEPVEHIILFVPVGAPQPTYICEGGVMRDFDPDSDPDPVDAVRLGPHGRQVH